MPGRRRHPISGRPLRRTNYRKLRDRALQDSDQLSGVQSALHAAGGDSQRVATIPGVRFRREHLLDRLLGPGLTGTLISAPMCQPSSMASANLDIVRSIYAAWEEGDFSSAEWAHPEIEYESDDPLLPLGRTKGVAGMAEIWRKWLRAWKDFRAEADEYHEVDGERVVVLLRYSGRGNPGGLEVAPIEAASLFHVRDGKVTRLVLYLDRGRALADVGLAPRQPKR
jgi:ketosteroid isomerase-like protein